MTNFYPAGVAANVRGVNPAPSSEIVPITSRVEVSSRFAVDPDVLWDQIASLEGVNFEMGPLLKMVPSEGENLFETAASGRVLKLKLTGPFGLPLGYYPLQLKRLEVGRSFLEQTWMLPFLLWQHERTIEPDGDGARITDRLGWKWRFTPLDRIYAIGTRAFFRHRHRRLRRLYGQGGGAAAGARP